MGMTTTTEKSKRLTRCLTRCTKRPENIEWTEKCKKRCEKLAAPEMEENEENNGKRRRSNKKTKKQKGKKEKREKKVKKEKKGESQDHGVKKVGPLETFIKFLFKRS